jgi:glutathione S-transferase
MIKLYGESFSRAFRCLWMLQELGVEYEQVPVDFAVGSKAPDYMKLNPNGRVPCLVDGELVLFESLAINLYLAKRFESDLLPRNLAGEARVLQWTLWATNELDAPLGVLSAQRRLPKEQRSATAVEQAFTTLKRPLRVLEAQLESSPYLLGTQYTLADLNVASVLGVLLQAQFDWTAFPRTQAWMGQCFGRPAAQRTVALALGSAAK